MAWTAMCDRCRISSLSVRHEPCVPEGWIQLRSYRLYCTAPACQRVGLAALRRQKPAAAQRAMAALYPKPTGKP